MASIKYIPDIDNLIKRYLSGESLKKISDEMNISRPLLKRRFLKAGIQLRGRSDANRLKWARITDIIVRKRQVAAAHAARRGMTDSACIKQARAATNFTRQLHSGHGEQTLIALLAAVGIPATHLKPVCGYNLDVALDELPIAVEIDSSRFYSDSAAVSQRLKNLLDSGWCILYVLTCGHANRVDIRAIACKVIALLDLARRDKTVFGQYGVINGKAKAMTTPRTYLDSMTRIPGF